MDESASIRSFGSRLQIIKQSIAHEENIERILLDKLSNPEYYFSCLNAELQRSDEVIVNHNQLDAFIKGQHPDAPYILTHYKERLERCYEIKDKLKLTDIGNILDYAEEVIKKDGIAYASTQRTSPKRKQAVENFRTCINMVGQILECYQQGSIKSELLANTEIERRYYTEDLKFRKSDQNYRALLASCGEQPLAWIYIKVLHLCKVTLLQILTQWIPEWMVKLSHSEEMCKSLVKRLTNILQYEKLETRPREVKLHRVNFNSVFLTWEPGHADDQDQVFYIKCCPCEPDDSVSEVMSEETASNSLTLKGLCQGKSYELTVISKTRLRTTKSKRLRVTIPEERTSIEAHVKDWSPSSLTVCWNATPSDGNYEYRVEYWNLSTDGGLQKTMPVRGVSEYCVDDLSPDTEYKLMVCLSDHTTTVRSQPITHKTRALEPVQIMVDEVTAFSVTFKWTEECEPGECHYYVEYRELGSTVNGCKIVSEEGVDKSEEGIDKYCLDGLQPDTEYEIILYRQMNSIVNQSQPLKAKTQAREERDDEVLLIHGNFGADGGQVRSERCGIAVHVPPESVRAETGEAVVEISVVDDNPITSDSQMKASNSIRTEFDPSNITDPVTITVPLAIVTDSEQMVPRVLRIVEGQASSDSRPTSSEASVVVTQNREAIITTPIPGIYTLIADVGNGRNRTQLPPKTMRVVIYMSYDGQKLATLRVHFISDTNDSEELVRQEERVLQQNTGITSKECTIAKRFSIFQSKGNIMVKNCLVDDTTSWTSANRKTATFSYHMSWIETRAKPETSSLITSTPVVLVR
ncbi:uncharacterized protein [Ptychodera flava]|uniref:uncharacterized protein n=1 Tax=Ptychodera flava TaxID=63121 RepID=UPI003969E674